MSRLRLRRLANVVSAASLALMLLGPSAVVAATPTVDVGSTSSTTNTSAATPGTVSIGETGWFRTTLQNKDSSTISQLYLGVFSDATLYSYGTPLTYAVTLTKNGIVVNGGCSVGTNGPQFLCSARNVKPLDVVQATFVLKIPMTYSDGTAYAGTVDADGTLKACPVGDAIGYANDTTGLSTIPAPATCVLSMWSSNGAPSSDGGSSHGDTWNFNDGVAINTDLQDFRGRYVEQGGQTKVENDQAIGPGNPHATTAYSPTTGIPVTVEDIDCDSTHYTLPDAPPAICSTLTGFGEISRVDVNGGHDVACLKLGANQGTCEGTTLLHFTLKLYFGEIPSGTNANNIGVNHVYPGGSETITTRCTFSPKTSTTPSNAPCITVTKLFKIGLQIDVWTMRNGGIRAF